MCLCARNPGICNVRGCRAVDRRDTCSGKPNFASWREKRLHLQRSGRGTGSRGGPKTDSASSTIELMVTVLLGRWVCWVVTWGCGRLAGARQPYPRLPAAIAPRFFVRSTEAKRALEHFSMLMLVFSASIGFVLGRLRINAVLRTPEMPASATWWTRQRVPRRTGNGFGLVDD